MEKILKVNYLITLIILNHVGHILLKLLAIVPITNYRKTVL